MIKPFLCRGALFFCLFLGVSATCTAREKSVIIVPMSKGGSFQDHAYLAAIPAATQLNRGRPVVLALDEHATLRPETKDFLNRYKPDKTYVLGHITKPTGAAAGLVNSWTFDEGAGVAARSQIGNLTGTIHRIPAWKDNKAGGYAFNGQAITVVNGSAPGSSPELTVAFWMKADEVKHQVVIGKLDRRTRSPGWAILLRNGKERNAIRFRTGGGGGAWHGSDLAVDHAYKANDWVHVTCTHADGVSKVYLNGKLKGTRKDITWGTPNNATQPILIGNTGWESFVGLMDELRIYDRALGPMEVERLPGATGPTTRGLVGYWPMDETKGKRAKNAVGRPDLRLAGDATWVKGHVGGAIRFNGKKDALQGPTNTAGPMTVTCRIASKAVQTCTILSKSGIADEMPPWHLRLEGKTLVLGIGDNAAALRAPDVCPPGKSVTVAFTYAEGDLRLLADGQVVASEKFVTWKLNRNAYSGSRFDGGLDDVRVFGAAMKQPDATAADGLVGSWNLDQAINDKELPFWADGRHGKGLRFDGKYVYAEFPSTAWKADALTVAFWIKPERPGCILSRRSESTDAGLTISLEEDRHSLLFEVDGRRTGLRHAEACPIGEWTHVTCSFAGGESTLYLNGRKVHVRREIKNARLKGLSAPLRIGAQLPGEKHFAGIVDDLRIFRQAVSEREARGLFGETPLPKDAIVLPTKDMSNPAITVAETFWTTSDRVVCCSGLNYGDSLVASALAARLRAPLLFVGKNTYPKSTLETIKRLKASEALVVGSAAVAPKGLSSVVLKDDLAVLRWLKKNKIPVDYLAAVNPGDMEIGQVRKTSIAGPLLAAGRDGAVVTLAFGTQWKLPFDAKKTVDTRPKDAPASKAGWKTGTIVLGGITYPFILSSTRAEMHDQITIETSKGKMVGPLRTGDNVNLGGRVYTLTLGRKDGIGQHDVRITSPTGERILEELKLRYEALGKHPEYLCIVGRPDVIPQAILLKPSWHNEDLPSDIPFAEADDDPFSEIAVGRFVAEDVWSATLIASRGLVYDDLIDPSWANRCATACWESLMDKDFQNVGFGETVHHSGKILFNNDSPLRNAAAIAHMEHSSWMGIGGFVDWQSKVLLAPAVIETGGCSTMSLDRNEDGHSAPVRLLRNGALAVAGNLRLGVGTQKHYRTEFWSALLAGKSVGQAHRSASNNVLLAVLEKKELKRGSDRYQYFNRALYGDPAVRVRLPSKPKGRRACASATEDGKIVTVNGPQTWWRYDERIVSDWRYTLSPKLYAFRGAGVGMERKWNNKKRCGTEKSYFIVEHRTRKRVTTVEQLDTLPKPLGWTGQFWTDHHQDGSRSVLWRVRLIDFDRQKGTIIHKADKVTYKLITE